MFDPGGYSGRLRGCILLGRRRATLRERIRLGRFDGVELDRVLLNGGLHHPKDK